MSKAKSGIPLELLSPSNEFSQASKSLGMHWWHWDQVERKLFLSPSLLKILGYTPV